MNPSVWSKSMYSSSNICLDGCTAEHLSSVQYDPVPSNPDVSGVSVTFHKDSENMKMPRESDYYSSDEAGSGLICSSQLELDPPRDSTTRRHPSPASSSCGHHDWNLSSGHQAKRARVENIIKGMTSSPGAHCTDVMTNQHEESDCVQESERIGELPLHQEHMERSGSGGTSHSQTTSKQLESQQQNLRQLRAKFNHVDEETETTDTSKENRKYQGWKKVKLMNYFQSKPERIKIPCCGNAEVQVPDVQTEALSLVVQKPRLDKFILQPRLRANHRPKLQVPFSHDFALHDDRPSQKNHSTAHQHALRCLQDGCPEVGQAKFEMFDTHWNSVKARSKVNSRSVRSPQTHTVSVDPMLLESLCLPHVKIESDSLQNNLYMLNEGLTTSHLKKAKLMFFYTRYPSSLVLKMCFHDVQFTRCITSQLIKWFSNFREFYYIQMEKFARHALIEGVADVRGLTVGRESELFRALNMHYNKANDFQVPDRFLEVAEITLREFYIAISMGKDHDPSWKKVIYKVICKLDSDIPAEFKSHHSG
uniref:Prospero homeobox protein 1-like n=1 Tax=Seriola lalandi dorsalis TaxID=1841481 RepID=A0A3B4WBX8_SERLL